MKTIPELIEENRLLTEENDALSIQNAVMMRLLCNMAQMTEAQVRAEVLRQLERMKEVMA